MDLYCTSAAWPFRLSKDFSCCEAKSKRPADGNGGPRGLARLETENKRRLLRFSLLAHLISFVLLGAIHTLSQCMQTGANSYFCTASLVDPICEEHGLRRSMHYKMLQGWTWKRKPWGMRGCNKQLPNATMLQLLRAWNLLCRLAVTQVNTVLRWIRDLSSDRQVLLSQEFKTLNASKCHVTQLYAVQLLRKN